MRAFSHITLAVLATVATTAVASAQTPPPRAAAAPKRDTLAPRPAARKQVQNGPQQGPRGGLGMPGARGMQSGGGAADRMIRMRQQLDLTDDQVKRLEAMRGASAPAMNPSDRLRAQADLMDATRGDINMEKARAAFDRMAKARTDGQLGRLKLQQDARNVLTAPQRAKIDALRGQMGARMGSRQGPRGGQMRDKMRNRMRKQMMRQRMGRQGGQMGPAMRGQMGARAPGLRQRGGPAMQPGMQGQMRPGMQPGMQGQMQPGMQGQMRRRMMDQMGNPQGPPQTPPQQPMQTRRPPPPLPDSARE